MEPITERSSQLWGVVKSPVIFNALAIIVMTALTWHALSLDLTNPRLIVLGAGYAFIVGVTFWLNWFAAHNPRFLAYGPNEYLRESEMEHQRKMK
jgi:hypothetical protein